MASGTYRHTLTILRLIESPTRDDFGSILIDAPANWETLCVLRAELKPNPSRSVRQANDPAADGAIAQLSHRWRVRSNPTANGLRVTDRLVNAGTTHLILGIYPDSNDRRHLLIDTTESHGASA